MTRRTFLTLLASVPVVAWVGGKVRPKGQSLSYYEGIKWERKGSARVKLIRYCRWTNASGDGRFENPENWTARVVPRAGDIVSN